MAAVVDPRFEIDEYLRARALPRRRDRARARDAQPRRPCLGPRPPGGRDRRRDPHPPRGGARLRPRARSTTAGSSSSATLTVRALHTPGHRPEHTAFALTDTRPRRGAMGGAHRRHAVRGRHRAARTWRSTRRRARAASSTRCTSKLLALPGDCEVWPGHLGGSLCGGPGMDMKVSSTIGYERGHNECSRSRTRTSSSRGRLAKLAPQPPNFERSSQSTAGRS